MRRGKQGTAGGGWGVKIFLAQRRILKWDFSAFYVEEFIHNPLVNKTLVCGTIICWKCVARL